MDATATANPEEAHGLVEFQKELARYVTLRDRVMLETPAGHAGARKPEASPGALATEIRRQRRGAKQGDVFHHEVQPLFRRAVAEEIRDPWPSTRARPWAKAIRRPRGAWSTTATSRTATSSWS